MTEVNIAQLKETLLQRRQEIFERLYRLEESWQELGEREIEWEEEAQKVDLSELYDRLDSFERDEIEQIDRALQKIGTTGFGICESCSKPIKEQRLAAIPYTRWCRLCAEKYS